MQFANTLCLGKEMEHKHPPFGYPRFYLTSSKFKFWHSLTTVQRRGNRISLSCLPHLYCLNQIKCCEHCWHSYLSKYLIKSFNILFLNLILTHVLWMMVLSTEQPDKSCSWRTETNTVEKTGNCTHNFIINQWGSSILMWGMYIFQVWTK